MTNKHYSLFAVALAVALAFVGGFTPDAHAFTLGDAGAFLPFMLVGDTELQQVKKVLSDIESSIKKNAEDVAGYTVKASDEIKRLGVLQAETNGKLGEVMTESKKLGEQMAETRERLQQLEQSGAKRFEQESRSAKSAGEMVAESPEYKGLNGNANMPHVQVKSFHKAAVVNATGQNQPLVPDYRVPGILQPALRALTMRGMIPVVRTTTNLIQFAKENTADMQAEPQYSSPNRENVLKKEAAITFTMENEAVQTIAHWIPVSRQVLSDAPMLQDYINTRLTYGVKLEEDDQILNGDGSGANLNGILAQATAYNHAVSDASDTPIDTILRAMNQAALSNLPATGIVLHPTDWTGILLTKDSNGNYVFGDPQGTTAPQMWGLPVNVTQVIAERDFLVGAFAMGATIYDREDATVRIAEQHSNFFVKNMVVLLAEERIALVVYRPTGFITGTFDA